MVRVFDTRDGFEHSALFAGATEVTGIAFSPDGRKLRASGWGSGAVKEFDSNRDPRGRKRIVGGGDQIAALSFDREGLRVREIDWESSRLNDVDPVDGSVRSNPFLAVTNERGWPRGDFALSDGASRLAAPLREDRSTLGVWDLSPRRLVARLRGSGGPVTAVAFHPDGQSLAIAERSSNPSGWAATLWQIDSARKLLTIIAGKELIRSLTYSGDGKKLAAGAMSLTGSAGSATVWDAQSGAVLANREGLGWVLCVAFNPDASRLAIADNFHMPDDVDTPRVRLWELASGTLLTSPAQEAVSFVGFSPDGTRLLSMGYDGNVHLADACTGDNMLVLRGFGGPIGNLGYTPRFAFSPDGSRIVANYAIVGRLNAWDLGPFAALSVTPHERDVAGWLRRGLALDDKGDTSAAQAAYTHARELKSTDSSPWIEHGVSLFRRGQPTQAREALARAIACMPDDPGRWIELGRLLEPVGLVEESEFALSMAASLLKRRLANAPDDDESAAALAELIPENDTTTDWTILQPDVMQSSSGAVLSLQADGSVFADNPTRFLDNYTIEAVAASPRITALRLEVLPDDRLPNRGPGYRPGSGLFALTSINLTVTRPLAQETPVIFNRASSAYSKLSLRTNRPGGAIDRDPNTFWESDFRPGQHDEAVFQPAHPIESARGQRLRVDLDCGLSGFPWGALGRFRLSITNRTFPLFGSALQSIRADEMQNGFTRLGAAHCLLGHWGDATAVLSRAASRSGATALDFFLLALARHHVEEHVQAQLDCDRAFALLKCDKLAQDTNDVAVEALIKVRGVSVDEAQALVFDAAFPVDPFSR